ncbi:Glycosyl transferase, family 10 [Cynara cardunculus var. scolymus]|uniref:Glycosyl transferase, family 10 n=1 Tax=Cynara cardunculus var. scolymus TaxID=59895 RepID=A0A103XJ41_CYNCS|nr:Glycosyl transferase, family 10 [Cynara cardunculus var. scolymus]
MPMKKACHWKILPVTCRYEIILWQGTTPIVVGAPIIQYFAPSPGSILHVKELTDVELVVKTMKQLAENLMAYNESLRQVLFSVFSFYIFDNV